MPLAGQFILAPAPKTTALLTKILKTVSLPSLITLNQAVLRQKNTVSDFEVGL
jgi:hypothetical protein